MQKMGMGMPNIPGMGRGGGGGMPGGMPDLSKLGGMGNLADMAKMMMGGGGGGMPGGMRMPPGMPKGAMRMGRR